MNKASEWKIDHINLYGYGYFSNNKIYQPYLNLCTYN